MFSLQLPKFEFCGFVLIFFYFFFFFLAFLYFIFCFGYCGLGSVGVFEVGVGCG